MAVDRAHLQRFAPLAVPVMLLAVGWVLFVRPAGSARDDAMRRIDLLRPRLSALQRTLGEPLPNAIAVDPAEAFSRQLASGDSAASLLVSLTRLASAIGARNLLIDATGTAAAVGGSAAGPRVAGAPAPDPRLALFETPLAYSTVPISFDTTYERLGTLLWRLRDLPTIVEIRDLTVTPRIVQRDGTAAPAETAAADGSVSVAMTLFVYVRSDADIVLAAGSAP